MTLTDFNTIVLPLKSKLFRFAVTMLKNRESAEDVVQDAFLKLWGKREGLNEIENIEAWCIRVVKNLCLDHFKSKHNKIRKEEPNENLQLHFVTPYKETEISDTYSQLEKVIEALPEQQQMIFKLRDIQEYSYKEIAEILEIDINIVKVNLHRARKAIRIALEKNEAYGI